MFKKKNQKIKYKSSPRRTLTKDTLYNTKMLINALARVANDCRKDDGHSLIDDR